MYAFPGMLFAGFLMTQMIIATPTLMQMALVGHKYPLKED